MSYTILHRDALYHYGNTYEYQGYEHGDANVSFIWVDMQPGEGPRLHKHPYEEVFIVQEGQVTFTVDTATLEVTAEHVVIVPPDTPHKFVNSGTGPLRQIDIHHSPRFITEWLED